MTKPILIILLLWLTVGMNTPTVGRELSDGKVRVTKIGELNRVEEIADSHAGEELYGTFEPVKKYMQTIPLSKLGCRTPIYARVKRLSNGSYLLVWQNARLASTIRYSLSDDLLTWSDGVKLFEPTCVADSPTPDSRLFSSADATVLSNGDVIAVTSFRANKGYRNNPEWNGIMMRRSSDNGLSWSEGQVIYVGTNWEPYILQLPSGKLQCYFTDTDPLLGNSGTSIIESFDNGKSWTPTGTSQCYKVIRQYKYDRRGKPIYTDQMPCVRVLNDGHTLLGFMESRLENADKESYFMLSLVYGKDDWQHLGEGETGPKDRQTNVVAGAAGYVSQFLSGETVISCNIKNRFSMKLGSADGRTFKGSSWQTDWYQPFEQIGYWGATEVIGSHEIVAAMHSSEGIQLGRFYLNHRIDAPKTKVKVDGDNAEWSSDQALFLGSEADDVQTVIRAAHDRKNLYLLFERTDGNVTLGDGIEVCLCNGKSKTLKDDALKIDIAPAADALSYRFTDGEWQPRKIRGIACRKTIVGTLDDDNPDEGYVAELSVPLSAVEAVEGGYVKIMVTAKGGSADDTFTGSNSSLPETWLLIKLNE